MTAAERVEHVSVEDYLAGELESEIKHEYLGGFVYAMAGAKNRHNTIAMNCVGSLFAGLRGKPCEARNSDAKVRIQLQSSTRFYYPDATVTCEAEDEDASFVTRPAVVVEVLSDSTRRTDEGEKMDAYLAIPSLTVYVLVEQDSPTVSVYRRTGDESVRETYTSLEATIPLPEIETVLALSNIYDRIDLQT